MDIFAMILIFIGGIIGCFIWFHPLYYAYKNNKIIDSDIVICTMVGMASVGLTILGLGYLITHI